MEQMTTTSCSCQPSFISKACVCHVHLLIKLSLKRQSLRAFWSHLLFSTRAAHVWSSYWLLSRAGESWVELQQTQNTADEWGIILESSSSIYIVLEGLISIVWKLVTSSFGLYIIISEWIKVAASFHSSVDVCYL